VTRILHLPVIEVHTLTDGGQTAVDIARTIAAFVDGAKETLELALYDIRLHDETADIPLGGSIAPPLRFVPVTEALTFPNSFLKPLNQLPGIRASWIGRFPG